MQWKKYLVVFVALALLLVLSGVTSAQYEHVITDAEDDVDYVINQSWTYDVERPNVDIIRVEISEGGEGVIVSLTVKGEITDAPNIDYVVNMVDGEGGDYGIHYNDGECLLYVDASEGQLIHEPATSGVGTSTLSVDIALEDIFEPDSLEISEVWTYEYIDEENEYYWDTAYPDDDDTDENDVTDPDDDDPIFDEDDDLPEFVEDWFERGMMCLALGVIIVVVIVIIIIVVIIKLVKKDDKGGEQPPRQEYQQPPPPAQSPEPSEMQYQEPVPPEETGGDISPGERITEEEEF